MSLAIAGMGWVTPLGTGVDSVWERLLQGEEPAATTISEQSFDHVYSVFRVPESALKGISHPRLRRASAISRFAAAAGLHALESAGLKLESQNAERIALIFAISNGGVSYTKRFYQEIVGSGAQVLGPFRVGDGARIGAAAVVLTEVPEGATMVGNPARQVARRSASSESKPVFQPYAVCGDIPDPIARALNGLLDEVTGLRARVSELEQDMTGQGPALDRASGEPPSLRLVARSGGNGTDNG